MRHEPAKMIKIASFLLVILILLSCFLCSGCASLPKASEIIDDASDTGQIQIASTKYILTPSQSAAIMKRLQNEAGATDILTRQIAVIEEINGSILKSGNKVSLLVNTHETISAMMAAIDNARDHINIETFIFADDDEGKRLSDLLLQKQASGVVVNVIYDSIGSQSTPREFFVRLREGGIRVVEFNPINPLKPGNIVRRDHRKVLIVDGTVVFTGGVNMSGVHFSKPSDDERGNILWRETDIRLEGPAVSDYQTLFINTWKSQNGPDLPPANYHPKLTKHGNDLVMVTASSPGSDNRLVFISYMSAIIFANKSAHITNAYFAPDDQMIDALKNAATRGVDVKIILPKITDSSWAKYAGQYHYSELLHTGVQLYERRNMMLHAKTAIIDNVWATVGSSNMDTWSFAMNDEVNAIVLGTEFASKMESLFLNDLKESDRIELKEWNERPLLQRIKEFLGHLFQRWL